MSIYNQFSTRATPQSEAIPGKAMVQNNAGGFGFAVDDFTRLDRFLILGSEANTYYQTARALTLENAQGVLAALKSDGLRAVSRVVEVSQAGRAPKNDPALFALALAASHGDDATRAAAFAALPAVARTGTHLLHFVSFMEQHRGWGRGARRALANWFLSKKTRDAAYQAVKYRSRDSWSQRDVLRLAHPDAAARLDMQQLFGWMTAGMDKMLAKHGPILEPSLSILAGFEALHADGVDAEAAAHLIRAHRLPHEAVPTHLKRERAVWAALLEEMPLTAMIRNLATMTRVGLLTRRGEHEALVVDRLRSAEAIRAARVHPVALLAAQRTYAAGRSVRGSNTWEPLGRVVEALDDAFYLAFANVAATGKRMLWGLDVSGSMTMGDIAGVPGLTPRAAAGALALVAAETEPHVQFFGFSKDFVPLNIARGMRLDRACQAMDGLPFDRTDCSVPMFYAADNRIPADVFVIVTDNETWAGRRGHPVQALQHYRQTMGIAAKCVVVAVTSTGFSIADPSDGGMLDAVGFDASLPEVIYDFVANGYGS